MNNLIQVLKSLCGEENPELFRAVLEEVKKSIAFKTSNGAIEVDTQSVLRLATHLDCMEAFDCHESERELAKINLADKVRDPQLGHLLSQDGIDDQDWRNE